MSYAFRIRNLTNHSFHLQSIDRSVAVHIEPVSNNAPLSSISKNVSGLLGKGNTTITRPPATEDCNHHIEAHASKLIHAAITSLWPGESLKFTFKQERQRYHVTIPTTTHSSVVLEPVDSDDDIKRFTAVYVAEESFLAIYSSGNLNSWMSHLDDHLPLSALSIPGTHNSATHYRALMSVRCQVKDIRTQLENGIRFLDLRLQPERPADPNHDGLILVHGAFPVSFTGTKYLRPLLDDIELFLTRNPSETVIVTMKREGTGTATDAQLSLLLSRFYAQADNAKWWTHPRLPTLGEARGKVVLLRRFALHDSLRACHDGAGYAIDAQHWTYNTAHEVAGGLCVQDYCDVMVPGLMGDKIRYACEQLSRAAKEHHPHATSPYNNGSRENGILVNGQRKGEPPLYLNFLSASNFWNRSCWPEKIAERLNPAVVRHLCVEHGMGENEHHGGTGVVVCDWVGAKGDWDLVRCIVGQNARLQRP